MQALANAILLAWIPVVLGLFMYLTPLRAMLTAVIGGWLFLPLIAINLPALPALDKSSATMGGILLGTVLFHPQVLSHFRLRWFDIPLGLWILVPAFSALHYDPDPWEALSAAFSHLVMWGMPYFVGRIYLTHLHALRETAIAIVIGALVYIPFCIWEMRMSPHLHLHVYGFRAPANWEAWWFLTPLQWKPTVFMDTAFSVSMLMAVAALMATVLTKWGMARRTFEVPPGLIAVGLVSMTILCKVTSGILMMFLGTSALLASRAWGTRLALLAVLLLPPTYMLSRATGLWSGQAAIDAVRMVDGSRARTLSVRISTEEKLLTRARERPILGWSRMGPWREGARLTDGYWAITMSMYGVVGLTVMTVTLLLPLALFIRLVPPRLWSDSGAGLLMAFALVPALHMIDNLANAFPNPLFYLIAGGVLSILAAEQRRAAAAPAARQPAIDANSLPPRARTTASQTPPLRADSIRP
ncbi:MAG: hypothetical protein WD009_01540 [Phycisphaeraceae bacterium]